MKEEDIPKFEDHKDLGKFIMACYVNKESGAISGFGKPEQGFFHDAQTLAQIMAVMSIYMVKSAEKEFNTSLFSEEFIEELCEKFADNVYALCNTEVGTKKLEGENSDE